MSVSPAEEVVEGALRRIIHAYPQGAIRELLSNMVIHQDLTVASSGPLVGLYDNRVEFSNPGALLFQLSGCSMPSKNLETTSLRQNFVS